MNARVCLTVATSLAFVAVAAAEDLLVPQEFDSIQAAIVAAEPGDRILVAAGTYAGPIDFLGKAIVVESTAGAAATILDGGGAAGFVVSVVGGTGEAVLSGFTVTGGFGEPGSLGAGPGGGMRIQSASAVVVGCIFTANAGIMGGAIQSIGGNLTIRDSHFDGNAALSGGAIYTEGGFLLAEQSTFSGNFATSSGGALSVVFLTDAVLNDLTFTENWSNSLGGAAYFVHASVNANGLDFIDNGLAEFSGHPEGSTITFTTLGGGAIYASSTSGRIDASRFVGNTAWAGGGLYVASNSSGLTFVNCLVTAHLSGLGNVYLNSASPSFVNCTIVDNIGFGIYTTFNSFPTIANTILAGHTGDGIAYTEIAGNGQVNVLSSLVDGSVFSAQVDDLSIVGVSPMLDENFVPLPGSPAIDAGDNSLVPADVALDLIGNQRIVDGLGGGAIVDLGAIEFGAAPPSLPPADSMIGHGTDGPTLSMPNSKRKTVTPKAPTRQLRR